MRNGDPVNTAAWLIVITVILAICASSMVYAVNAWVRSDPTISLKDQPIKVSFTADDRAPAVDTIVKMHVNIDGTFGRGNTTCLTPWWIVDGHGYVGRDKDGNRAIICGPPFQAIEQPVMFKRAGEAIVILRLLMQGGTLFREETLTFDVRPIPAAH
jgi:hypothetical protein